MKTTEGNPMDITQIMKPEYMTLEVHSTEKEEVIKQLIALLKNNGIVIASEPMFAAVMKRESEFSTGIGFGIAIPHAQCEYVSQAAIAFGRSDKGVIWTGEETTIANLIFLIAVPLTSQAQHLQLLAHISRRLIHDEVRQQILLATDKQGIIEALS